MKDADLTGLLLRWREGDKAVETEIIAMIYNELKSMVQHYRARELGAISKQTTELVNELYMRIAARGSAVPAWENRGHFFGVAAKQMRQVLVDEARARHAGKRGGLLEDLPLNFEILSGKDQPVEIVALNEALCELEVENANLARVIDLVYFIGLQQKEAAEALGISVATLARRVLVAKRWLYVRLDSGRSVSLGAVKSS